MSNTNKIQYRQVGDYFIPNLILPPEEANTTLSKWGMLHKSYLEKHKKVLFSILLMQGKLWQYLSNIDTQAQQMFDALVEQMKEREGVTEKLKEKDQMIWIQKTCNIQNQATEIVLEALIDN